ESRQYFKRKRLKSTHDPNPPITATSSSPLHIELNSVTVTVVCCFERHTSPCPVLAHPPHSQPPQATLLSVPCPLPAMAVSPSSHG
ncbi:mCG1046109, isoform CRA_c, partial [Mus musculus]